MIFEAEYLISKKSRTGKPSKWTPRAEFLVFSVTSKSLHQAYRKWIANFINPNNRSSASHTASSVDQDTTNEYFNHLEHKITDVSWFLPGNTHFAIVCIYCYTGHQGGAVFNLFWKVQCVHINKSAKCQYKATCKSIFQSMPEKDPRFDDFGMLDREFSWMIVRIALIWTCVSEKWI